MAEHNKLQARSKAEYHWLVYSLVVAFFILILDQITKLMVEQRMVLGESIPVIKGFFSLTYVTNKGAAWGMFHGYGVVLFCVGMLVIVATTYFLRKLCEGYRERYVAILAVLSGVVGNSIDRIWRGAVVDFLDCYINSYHWPAFNIADCAICVGIGVYMLSVILRPEAKKDAEKSENAN